MKRLKLMIALTESARYNRGMKSRPDLQQYLGTTHHGMRVVGIDTLHRSKFQLQCHCGKSFTTRYDWVLNGKVKSCGCSKSVHLKTRNKIVNYKKLPCEQAAMNMLFTRYKKGAAKRNLTFSIERSEFEKLVKNPCAYCGISPKQKISSTESTGVLLYNGLDRVINTEGYSVENCVACCKRCNFFKGPQSGPQFLELIKTISTKNTLTNQFKEHKLSNYIERAESVAKNSPDFETKVGSLLIKKDSGAVIADAYNGFCRGVRDDKLPNCRPNKYNYMVHSEANLIANCAKHGISTDQCIVICTLSPCKVCIRMLYQCGINTVYFKDKYRDFEENVNMADLSLRTRRVGDFFKLEIEPAV